MKALGSAIRSRQIPVCAIGLVLAALVPASAGGRSIRPPVVGDWEGKGTDGLQLSFQLAHVGSRIRAQALALTLPVGCPATVRDTVAVAGTRPVYAGPHAAPPGLSHPLLARPGTIGLSLSGQPFPLFLEGPLVSPRRMRLSIQGPSGKNVACWPRTLRFNVQPATRIAVADGRWSGTLTGATGVTGTIRLTVAGRGRAITTFAFNLNCNSSIGSGSFSYGPDNNGQFIAANGTFSGPAAHSAAPALRIAWNGQFSSYGIP